MSPRTEAPLRKTRLSCQPCDRHCASGARTAGPRIEECGDGVYVIDACGATWRVYDVCFGPPHYARGRRRGVRRPPGASLLVGASEQQEAHALSKHFSYNHGAEGSHEPRD